MSEFDNFIQKVQERFPGLKYEIDKAETKSGSTWVDIYSEEESITIEFRPNYGFGLYKGDSSSYGEGPNEIYRSQDLAVKRVEAILKDHKLEVRLDELQEMFGQADVKSKESNISNHKIQELISFIESRGGSLEINAHFEECDLPISLNSVSNNM
ncbi:MAG: hypothetical protein ABUK01_11185 [Leptospirales bacterium]